MNLFNKLPGVNSYKKSVRIFSKIYYVFLVLLFCILIIRDRSYLGKFDALINICEMFLFWFSFVVPVVVAGIFSNRHFGNIEISLFASVAVLIVLTASIGVGTLYSESYKAEYGDSTSVFEKQ